MTLPVFIFREPDADAEAKEAATRTAEIKTIRAGREAWRSIDKAESLESWKLIGAALAVGKGAPNQAAPLWQQVQAQRLPSLGQSRDEFRERNCDGPFAANYDKTAIIVSPRTD